MAENNQCHPNTSSVQQTIDDRQQTSDDNQNQEPQLSVYRKTIHWLRTNKFYRTTECFGLRYNADAEYDIEVILWHVLMVFFIVGCTVHMKATLSEYSNEIITHTSFAVPNHSDYSHLNKINLCTRRMFGGTPDSVSKTPLDVVYIGRVFSERQRLPIFDLRKFQCAMERVQMHDYEANIRGLYMLFDQMIKPPPDCVFVADERAESSGVITLMLRRYLQAVLYYESPTHEARRRGSITSFHDWIQRSHVNPSSHGKATFLDEYLGFNIDTRITSDTRSYAQSQFWLDAWLQRRR